MSFAVAAEAYDRFMGRYSTLLAPVFADFARVGVEGDVLDVGCGPGALTTELVRRLGTDRVTAADPSESFVVAARERHPGVTVEEAAAEELPFDDDRFDAALAQLVVHFMTDPVRGIAEMGRVTRTGGTVAACVWDHAAGGHGPLSPFWTEALRASADAVDESSLPGSRRGDLRRLFGLAGLSDIIEEPVEVSLEHASFDEWWEPYTLGVGPAGVYVSGLDASQRAELERRCRELFPHEPFTVTARAWACRGAA